MRRLRIAYAIHSLESGGAQRQAAGLAAELVKRGEIEARFFVYHETNFFMPALREAGIEVSIIRKSGTFDPFFPRRVRAWLRAHPVDVVHALLDAPSLWSLLALRGLRSEERPALLCAERSGLVATSLPHRLLQSFIYRRSDVVTVNAANAAPEIETRCGVPRERIHYIPNGIDLDAWDRTASLASPVEVDPGRFHVALIGRLAPQKNHRLLLDALARIGRERLAGWKIWCIGAPVDARFLENLRSEAASRGLSELIEFLPPHPDIAAFLKRLDVLVLPSLFEGFPNVVLEAMASGVPVIATSVGDVPNLVEPGVCGLLIASGDVEQLAEALLRVHALGSEGRRAMGAAGRRIVEQRFQMSTITDAHLALYRSLRP